MTIFYHQNDLPDNSPLFLADSIAIDTETLGLHLHLNRLCVVQCSSGDGHAHLVHLTNMEYNCPNLIKILENDKILKIFHYARFDLAILLNELNILCDNIFCTRTASRIVRTYSPKHGLKDLVHELVGVELNKEQQSSYWGGESLSEAQQQYAANDVLYLHKCMEKLLYMGEREQKLELIKQTNDFIRTRVILDLMGLTDDIFAHN